MPCVATVFNWFRSYPKFLEQYVRAKEESADALVDDMLHIADTPQHGVKTKTTEKGIEIVEGDMVEHRRLQVDTRKWIAAKLKPKKYGDKVDHNVTGNMTISWPLPKTLLDQ